MEDELDALFGKSAPQRPAAMLPPVKPLVREWVDNTGKYTTVGRLAEIGTSYVRLAKSNGKFCTVPFRRLSPADVQYLHDMKVALNGTDVIKIADNR